MPISNIACITPEPDDHPDTFGCSIAINDKYLAIGDVLANRVVIYTPYGSNQWQRSKVVLPPSDSIPDRFHNGFGEKLELDGNFLAISASVQTESEVAKNLEGFQRKANNIYCFNERYLINLDRTTEVTFIGLPVEKNGNLVTFNLLSNGKIRQVTLSNNGEREFGTSFAYHKNLLLVGSPSYREERGAWLYDIEQLNREPEKLAVPNVYMGKTVAINENFAVVGDYDYQTSPYRLLNGDCNQPKSTLIRAIKNGLTTTMETRGEVSLSSNILAFVNPSSSYFVDGGTLELHRLNKYPSSRRILMRGLISNALVQNGFLIIAFDNYELARHEIHIQEIN